MATYLYGVIQRGELGSLGPIGLPSGEEEVYVVGLESIAGVVSDYHGPEFSDLPQRELRRQRIIHKIVVSTVMREHPILPARFGTVLSSNAELLRALSLRAPELKNGFQECALVEYEVAVGWEWGSIFDEIAEEEEIAALRVAADSMPLAASLQVRLALGSLMRKSLAGRRKDIWNRLTSLLKEHSVDHTVIAPSEGEAVENVVFLVPRSAQEKFVGYLREAGAFLDGVADLDWVGPLPPHNFFDVAVVEPDSTGGNGLLRLSQPCEKATVPAAQSQYAHP